MVYHCVCFYHVRLLDSRHFNNDPTNGARHCSHPWTGCLCVSLSGGACLSEGPHFRNQQVSPTTSLCQLHRSPNLISFIAELILVRVTSLTTYARFAAEDLKSCIDVTWSGAVPSISLLQQVFSSSPIQVCLSPSLVCRLPISILVWGYLSMGQCQSLLAPLSTSDWKFVPVYLWSVFAINIIISGITGMSDPYL